MITAAGERIDPEELRAGDHIFYIILIHRIIAGRNAGGRYAIKIGKSHNGQQRMQDYQRAYSTKGFKILHMRRFQKKKEHGFDVQGTHRETWADGFERAMIRELKKMEIEPLYSRNPASSEYYDEDDEKNVFKALDAVVLRLSEEIKPKKNRRSKRIQGLAAPQTRQSARVKPQPVETDPPQRTRNYQGFDQYDFKNDFVPR